MWESVARFIIRFRWLLLFILLASTAFMAYHAAGVQLSYEFTRAIPEDNPKYQAYQSFRKQFGEDGNLLKK
jgi:predicted RND superfamily exporter protein